MDVRGVMIGMLVCVLGMAAGLTLMFVSDSSSNSYERFALVEQAPPAPSSFHEEPVGRTLVRVDDYERGVTCYRYSRKGGVWCYVSGVKP